MSYKEKDKNIQSHKKGKNKTKNMVNAKKLLLLGLAITLWLASLTALFSVGLSNSPNIPKDDWIYTPAILFVFINMALFMREVGDDGDNEIDFKLFSIKTMYLSYLLSVATLMLLLSIIFYNTFIYVIYFLAICLLNPNMIKWTINLRKDFKYGLKHFKPNTTTYLDILETFSPFIIRRQIQKEHKPSLPYALTELYKLSINLKHTTSNISHSLSIIWNAHIHIVINNIFQNYGYTVLALNRESGSLKLDAQVPSQAGFGYYV